MSFIRLSRNVIFLCLELSKPQMIKTYKMLIDDLKLARHLCFQSLGLKYSSGSELSWHQFFFISYCCSTNRRELDHIFLANPAGSVCFLRYKLEFGLREVYKFYQIPL